MEAPPQQEIQVQALKDWPEALQQQVADLHYDGFGGKRCCLCFGDSKLELRSSLSTFLKRGDESKMEVLGLALADGEAVGFAQLGFHDMVGDFMMPVCFRSRPEDGSCHLERIVVSEKMRGRGVGRELLKWVDEKAKERGCKKLKLEVVSNNPAKRLYERQGYVSVTKPWQKVCMCPCVFCLMGHLYFDSMWKDL